MARTPESKEKTVNQSPYYAIAAALWFMLAMGVIILGSETWRFLPAAYFVLIAVLCVAMAFISSENETGYGEPPESKEKTVNQSPYYAIAAALWFMLAMGVIILGSETWRFLPAAYFVLIAVLCVAMAFISSENETGYGEPPESKEKTVNQSPYYAIAAALWFMLAMGVIILGSETWRFLPAAYFALIAVLCVAMAFICAKMEAGISPAANSDDIHPKA